MFRVKSNESRKPISLLVLSYFVLSIIRNVHSKRPGTKDFFVLPINIPIYLLSSSILQDFCIAYSASNDNGSEAVSSCNSLLDIHLWYLFGNVLLALPCYEKNTNSLFHMLFFIRNQYHTASNYFHIFVEPHFRFNIKTVLGPGKLLALFTLL